MDDTTSVPEPLVSGEQDDPNVDPNAAGFRLLTTDEWELAARWRHEDTNTVTGYENPWFAKGNSVGGEKANAAGLRDMSGNVIEWCFDLGVYDTRIGRGGNWYHGSADLMIGRESQVDPDFPTGLTGFQSPGVNEIAHEYASILSSGSRRATWCWLLASETTERQDHGKIVLNPMIHFLRQRRLV